jgi:hypothetical protein
MTRDSWRHEAEQLALRLLAQETTWTCPTSLAGKHNQSWRVLARALRRLEGRGMIAGRQVEVPRKNGRIGIRREYRLQVNNPLLVMMPRFDPTQYNIVGVRVVRFD